jgi:hypothetical protein
MRKHPLCLRSQRAQHESQSSQPGARTHLLFCPGRPAGFDSTNWRGASRIGGAGGT